MVISFARQVIQPLTKLVNKSLSQRGRERLLNPPHLTVYYKLLCKEVGEREKERSFIPFSTLPSPILYSGVRRK
jgi:hypothetical protein